MPDLRALLAGLEWQRDALCAEPAYRDLPWFPEQGDNVRATKAVCARCLVRDDCLAFALAEGIDDGVWGGTTGRNLQKLRRSRLVVSSGRRAA